MAADVAETRFVRLAVFSHKVCWRSPSSPSGYATDGGFPFQMHALSELFDSTSLLLPCAPSPQSAGETDLRGQNLRVVPLTIPGGSGQGRKLRFPLWLIRNCAALVRELRRADAVHAPIPGDVGTIGMLLAFALGKPLFVRHCGNWLCPRTRAEHFWKWFMERFAGGRNVMLATGGASEPPSSRNANVRWIFSTSLTAKELADCETDRKAPNGGRLRLIIAARQERAKGAGIVIECLPLLVKKFPGATLDVVGDGAALLEFRHRAAAAGMTDRVIFHGKVAHVEVLRLLQRADVFCFPTTSSEGFPKAVLEALACGLPVVTTKVSVLPQLIGDGCGVLIDEASPKEVAQAVEKIVSQPHRYEAMSILASKTAKKYSLENWRAEIGLLLRSAWNSPGRLIVR